MLSSANGRGIRLLASADHVRPTIINESEDSYCFPDSCVTSNIATIYETNTDVRPIIEKLYVFRFEMVELQRNFMYSI